jgi:hypothetical protein
MFLIIKYKYKRVIIDLMWLNLNKYKKKAWCITQNDLTDFGMIGEYS